MKPHRTILGMEPWMFWLLLACFIFAVAGPEIAMVIKIESQRTTKTP